MSALRLWIVDPAFDFFSNLAGYVALAVVLFVLIREQRQDFREREERFYVALDRLQVVITSQAEALRSLESAIRSMSGMSERSER